MLRARFQKGIGAAVLATIVLILYFLAPTTLPQSSQLIPFTTPTTLKPRLVGAPISLSSHPGEQTYPRAIRLHSGSLLASFTSYDPANAIRFVISTDEGLSWSPHGTLVLKPADKATPIDNSFLFELPSGRILCTLRAHTKKLEALHEEEKPGGQNEGYLYFRLKIYYSDDKGKTWEHLSTPIEEQGPAYGNWEPFLRLSNSGELQFYYSRELGGGRDQDNLIRVSHDEGVSWSDARIVSGENLQTRDGMVGIQEVVPGSGHLMAVFETVEEKGDAFEARFELWTVTSRDDGNTWEERRLIYDSWFGDAGAPNRLKRNAGAPSIALVGKTLVVSFMTDEEKLEGMWHRNAYIKIITSDDGGLTWGNKLIIAEKPAAWAGLLTLNNTNFLVLCQHGDQAEAQHVALG